MTLKRMTIQKTPVNRNLSNFKVWARAIFFLFFSAVVVVVVEEDEVEVGGGGGGVLRA